MQTIVIHGVKDLRIEGRQANRPGPGEVLVRIAAGGVCGTDLHYYSHGGLGTIRLREPMILGHEISGYVAELGEGVEGLAVGDLVAVSPSRPCGACEFCAEGLRNHCANMRFYGSAMPFPHIQGAFREELVADAGQCVIANGLSPAEAAMAEPLAVVLHATRRIGDVLGKKILVTGCGPIGTLAVIAARRAGAGEIVATDLASNALEFAVRVGADKAVNPIEDPEALTAFAADKGTFDVLYECSGAQSALAAGIAAMRPRGVILQLGLGGDFSLPMMQLTAKELDLRGSFRFHEEFAVAVAMMRSGLIDVKPLVSHTIPFEEAVSAFEIANDRNRAMKVQLAFS